MDNTKSSKRKRQANLPLLPDEGESVFPEVSYSTLTTVFEGKGIFYNKRINIFQGQFDGELMSNFVAWLAANGAIVSVTVVTVDKAVTKHDRTVYVFKNDPNSARLAEILCNELRPLDRFKPCFSVQKSNDVPDFAIWFAQPIECRKRGERSAKSELPSSEVRPPKMTKEQKTDKREMRELKSRLAFDQFQAPLKDLKAAQLARPLVIYSKRGSRIPGRGHCDNCHAAASFLWRYAESSRGAISLCGRCQPILYSRSHGGGDAINRAVFSSFESNRRKH